MLDFSVCRRHNTEMRVSELEIRGSKVKERIESRAIIYISSYGDGGHGGVQLILRRSSQSLFVNLDVNTEQRCCRAPLSLPFA